MRWIRYSTEGRTAYGILEGEIITEVKGDPFDSPEMTSRKHELTEVKVEVPVIPRTFYCAGLNYTGHIEKYAAVIGQRRDFPERPEIGYRANNALIAHCEPVIIPADATEQVQYEGELVVVIGRKAKHLSESGALSCVFGYTIGNDVSERSWQASDRTSWRAKNTDTFKPMGPWIETAVDLDKMETIVRVNGVETTRFPTGSMLFGIATYIAAMTRYITLYPGDVISMGTDGISPNLRAGDVVEIEITGIGTLRNPFARA